ncbi:hypothetical protein CkaCkLH20_02929 [Colletotrichum karsti]|uniref:Azaphilone pigments biosynthesis cluster protein L N-terminal domain-containing protein n=1 Tax=Colletotrichum karsti TaxID=1095194 RepID=A0A9P6ICM8_9PEZI|nr:uncharacterized protein CkaCkLH20_02929 [Colletotrichum karsti]KAF9879386.1 hypothetical protein CkaCkLH20_02929 [Colletotrichum karsti]
MAEVLAVASGAVGLIAGASQGIRALSEEINRMRNAPEDLSNVRRQLQSVEHIVESIRISVQADGAETTPATQNDTIVTALRDCSNSCKNFRSEFQTLLVNGEPGLRERFRAAWYKNRVNALLADIHSCKSTVSLALSGANYFAACEQYKQLQVLATRESKQHQQQQGPSASEQNARIDQLTAELERAMPWARRYQEQVAFLKAQVDQRQTNLDMGHVEMLNSRGAVGITNADGTEGDLNVKIGDVRAESSRAVIGYSKNVDVNALFK